MSRPELRLINGGGDVVTALEEALADARAGKIEGLVLVTVETGGEGSGYGVAWHDDAPFIWARLVALTGSIVHDLMAKGLPSDNLG